MAPGPQALRLVRLSIDQVSRNEGPPITCTFLDKTNQRRLPIRPSRSKKSSGKNGLEDEIESDQHDMGRGADASSSSKATRKSRSLHVNATLRYQSPPFISTHVTGEERDRGRSGLYISSEDEESDSDNWEFTITDKRKPSDTYENPRKKSKTLQSTEIVVLSSSE